MSTAANEVDPTAPPGADLGEPRTTIGGRYEVELNAPLAVRGVTLIYRGRDLRTRGEVAVKTLRLEYRHDPDIRARFRREARLLAFLAHPSVIRVLDFVEDRGAYWVVLERLTGRTVKDLIAERGPLPLGEAARVLDQVAAALCHLHGRGLVHLDLKPQNILVIDDGRVKLIDFGLAQPADDRQTPIAGSTFDAAAYLAPEQVCGVSVDVATDVYALGCLVYELLTGGPPFTAVKPGSVTDDLIRARTERNPEPPSRVRPDLLLPRWVDDVLLRALARDPTARYRDVESLARVFRAGLNGEAVGGSDITTLVEVSARTQAPIPRPEPHAAPPKQAATVPAAFGRTALGARHLHPVGGSARRSTALWRPLWLAVGGLAILDAMLALLLFLSQGSVPGIHEPNPALRPGATAKVIVDGLPIREAPGSATTAIAGVDLGDRLAVTGEAIPADGTAWWPVTSQENGATVAGYAAAEGISAVEPTPLQRLRDALGLD